jgi:aspartate kinase
MALIVQKYGGTSVGSVERIKEVATKVKNLKNKGNQVVVSVSAMSGETNRLLELAYNFQHTPNKRELDVLLTTGEQTTIALLAMALEDLNCHAVSLTGGQACIQTDDSFGKARIKNIDNNCIKKLLNQDKVVIVAGFQGIDEFGNITTLGRGGSDTTAVALAAALKADECQILTDVDGVYTTDPRVEPNARRIDKISYEEMLEMASLGSKVLQIRSVEFAAKYQVPLRVLSSMVDEPVGTLIINEENIMEREVISGIAFNKDETKLSLIGVPDVSGIAYKILEPIAGANIEVDMIVQSVSAREGLTNFAFTVHRSDYDNALKILENVGSEIGAKGVQTDDKVVKVSIVGVGMRSHAGVAAQMFKTLYDNNINIEMISTSEIKISVVINEKYLELAVRSLHEEFDLEEK